MTVMLENGDVIFSDEDFKVVVTEALGFEAGQYVQELIAKGDSAYHRANSDFASYEAQVEEQRNALLEIDKLLSKMKDAKPAKREDLIKKMISIIAANV